MNGLIDVVVGPLAGPECRRLAGRGWSILIRSLMASALASVVLATLWWWWLNQTRVSPSFLPYLTLRIGLISLLGLTVTFALVMTPAMLAGSLAGDRDRQAMGLLLTTRVNAFEIVRGRLAGRYSQIGMALLAGLPFLLLLAGLAGIGYGPLLVMALMGPVLVFGAGGITAAASSVSKRGRDALLGTYSLGILLLLTPTLVNQLAPVPVTGLQVLNPYGAIWPLCIREETGPALGVIGWWGGLGIIGTLIAAVRLRPTTLKWLAGETPRKRGARRLRRVPEVGDRPMLWKELHIERGGSIGGFGRWIGLLCMLFLVVASTVTGLLILRELMIRKDLAEANRWTTIMSQLIADSATFFGVLVQLAVGLRAAVSIANERERMTWDGLLTSPLEGREIVWSKLWGSLYALRWLVVAILYAWGVAVGFGAMRPWPFLTTLVGTVTASAFLAAVGIRSSLSVSTATTSMAVTVGTWLGTLVGFTILSWMLVGIGALVCVVFWLSATQLGLTARPGPWFPVGGKTAAFLISNALYVGATISLSSETALRFDRLAGRMSAGRWAVTIDQALHGAPLEPVELVEPVGRSARPEEPEPAGTG